MAERFYRDYGIAEVERLARAICFYQGRNPDSMVAETGYRDSAMMPLWWRYQEDALKYIAMREADRQSSPDPER